MREVYPEVRWRSCSEDCHQWPGMSTHHCSQQETTYCPTTCRLVSSRQSLLRTGNVYCLRGGEPHQVPPPQQVFQKGTIPTCWGVRLVVWRTDDMTHTSTHSAGYYMPHSLAAVICLTLCWLSYASHSAGCHMLQHQSQGIRCSGHLRAAYMSRWHSSWQLVIFPLECSGYKNREVNYHKEKKHERKHNTRGLVNLLPEYLLVSCLGVDPLQTEPTHLVRHDIGGSLRVPGVRHSPAVPLTTL